MPGYFRHSRFLVLGIWFLVLSSLVLVCGCGRKRGATSAPAPAPASASKSASHPVSALAFSPDGKKLAASIYPKTIIWDTESGKELVVLENAPPSLSCLAFSADGKLIAGGIGNTINVWSAESGKVEKTLSGHSASVKGVGFSADGKTLVSSAGLYNGSSSIAEVWLWDVDAGNKGNKTGEIKAGQGMITCMAMSPDHKIIATGSMDGSVSIRDLAQKSEIAKVKPGSNITCLVFSPDGKTLAVANSQGVIFFFEHAAHGSDAWKEKNKIEGDEDLILDSLAYWPDGKSLAGAGNDKTIKIWDPATRKLAKTLEGHSQTVTALVYDPKDKLLASGSQDGEVRLWDPATGQTRQTLK